MCETTQRKVDYASPPMKLFGEVAFTIQEVLVRNSSEIHRGDRPIGQLLGVPLLEAKTAQIELIHGGLDPSGKAMLGNVVIEAFRQQNNFPCDLCLQPLLPHCLQYIKGWVFTLDQPLFAHRADCHSQSEPVICDGAAWPIARTTPTSRATVNPSREPPSRIRGSRQQGTGPYGYSDTPRLR
jgi:hypothetical protein